jgi:hypothetical protein
MPTDIEVKKLDDFRWLLPKKGKMRTEGLVYADERMMAVIRKDASLEQVANVACLPGIVGRSLAMPDIHWGYLRISLLGLALGARTSGCRRMRWTVSL